MVNGGLLKINDDSEPSFDDWATKLKPNDFTRLYFDNKDAGRVRNLSDFVKTIERAKRQPVFGSWKKPLKSGRQTNEKRLIYSKVSASSELQVIPSKTFI